MLVRDKGLKYNDGVLIKAVGQLKFEVSCFKDLVCQNSYIIAQVATKLGMSVSYSYDLRTQFKSSD